PELEACRALGPRAVERLSTAMNELLDGDGLVHARYLGQYRQLVACWSRMRLLCAAVDELPWSAEMTEQADRAVVHLLRLTRADGSQALGPTGRDHAPEPKWFTAIARSTGNRSIVRLARAVAGAKVDLPSEKRVGAAANDSEWAELAILRSDWTRQAARLTVAYVDRCARSELAIGKHLLFCGESTISLRQNDRSCTMESDWEQVCWETNDDCDYLELEAEFSGGIKVQRQMMLARHDQIAYLADAIVCAEPGDLSYETSFPLSPKLEFQPAIESNEAQLGDHKPRALVLPIALPEWRSATRNGSLVADEHVLRFHHSAAQVRGLYAPMFIDLKPKRFAQQFTWRRLTVAEDRSVVPADVAAGFRVHIGNRQWLVYRSLHPGGSRTVLGHHLYSEFVLGQFTSDGTIDPLIEIE
ncbi:MAG TPA: hypothetical protein VG713_06110, partial [Pirellulales bacterium]|nr:hypothetical protein [Pirellulales bacterium]